MTRETCSFSHAMISAISRWTRPPGLQLEWTCHCQENRLILGKALVNAWPGGFRTGLAQAKAYAAHNRLVGGSSPSRPTIKIKDLAPFRELKFLTDLRYIYGCVPVSTYGCVPVST